MSEAKLISNTIFEDDNAILNFISLIESEDNTYKLGIGVKGLNVDVKFTKSSTDNFELSFELNKEENFDLEYFFIKPAVLFADGMKIFIQNKDVKSIHNSYSEKSPVTKCKIEVQAFRGDFDDSLWLKSKQAAFYRYETAQFEPYESGITFDITTNKDQKYSFKNGVLLNIEDSPILFYYEQIDTNYGYYIFKSQKEIDFNKFEKIINSARAALGLISGFYMGDNVYFISLDRSKGLHGITYRYNNIKENINNKYPLLDHGIYKDIPESELNLNSNQFNELVRLLYIHEEYLRASLLLINAGNTQGISKGSLAAVALETISSTIEKKQSTKKIVTEKRVESQLKYELKKGLKKIQLAITEEQYKTFETKIDHINTIPNAQKLEDSFRLLGIELDEDELYCLSCRNRLFHGALPKNKNLNMLNNDQLILLISNRLILLSAILLLKKAGYGGKVIDWGFTEVTKRMAISQGKRIKAGNAFRNIETKHSDF